jgi:hypothetical protein
MFKPGQKVFVIRKTGWHELALSTGVYTLGEQNSVYNGYWNIIEDKGLFRYAELDDFMPLSNLCRVLWAKELSNNV